MKNIKKALSILVALVVIVSAPCTAFAAAAENGCEVAPVVYVRGFGSPLYLNPNSDAPEQVFMPSTAKILGAVPEILSALNSGLILKNYDRFGGKLIDALNELCDIIACDENGDSVYEVGFPVQHPSVDNHRAASYGFENKEVENPSEFVFHYDWRLDPLVNADYLDDYIEEVEALTNHSEVVIACHSEGTCVTASYLYKYGNSEVKKLLCLSGAFQGLSLATSIYTGNVRVKGNGCAVEEFIATFLGGDASGELITAIVSILNDAGILDCVLNSLQDILDSQLDRIINDCLLDIIVTMPGIWSFIEDGGYEQAKLAMFGEDGGKYSGLIERIDEYHYNVQRELKSLLQGCIDSGIPVIIGCGYNISSIPVVEDWKVQSDFLIDTKNTSIGATCAPVNTPFADSRTGSYVSADRLIDASTCAFPDKTWFFKGQDHNNFNAAYIGFLTWAILYDGQPTVFTNASYPQFLEQNGSGAFVPAAFAEPNNSNDYITIAKSLYELTLGQIF